MIAALADPTRRKLFERLSAEPLSVTNLAEGLAISRPAVSQHLKVLKDAELVDIRRAGTRRIYSARAQALGELREYVDGLWRGVLSTYSAGQAEGDDG